MSRRPARCTEADLKRAIKAAQGAGLNFVIEIPKDGPLKIISSGGEVMPAVAPEPPSAPVAGFVYFIKRGSRRGAIKIGFSITPKKRLARLQTGMSDDLILLGTMPGTLAFERQLHTRFKHLRLRGEWFSPAKELTDFIFEARQ